ncbi:hypothetical protein R5R35_006344 [Gryllus longicercus]|uniref:Accessory gland protein n=1 Tax=Gryllus longicercus TaxID=2509291 RepID=A0AAN9WMI6_9ORTH
MELLSAALVVLALAAGALWLLGAGGGGAGGGRLPPGPRGLPLVGSLLSLDARAPHLSLTALARRHAPAGAFSLRLGAVRCVVLTDAALVRRAFELDACAGRAPLFLTHGIMGGKGQPRGHLHVAENTLAT